MVSQSQLIQFINCSHELKAQMKEEFYKQKIQEAKINKGTPQFNWDELPEEVEEIIIEYKEQMEYSKEHSYIHTGYISDVIDEHKITGKSVEEYLFHEYKNENGGAIPRIPNVKWDTAKFLSCVINKKSFVKHYYRRSQGTKTYPVIDMEFLRITKHKTPSLEELIVFRNKQRKKASEDRKAKNKASVSTTPESKFKVGDLIYDSECINYNDPEYRGVYHNAYIITGETKTQYRVDRIKWSIKDENGNYDTRYWYGLSKDRDTWERVKSSNFGKKANIRKLDNRWQDDNCPFNYDDYYVEQKFISMD